MGKVKISSASTLGTEPKAGESLYTDCYIPILNESTVGDAGISVYEKVKTYQRIHTKRINEQ